MDEGEIVLEHLKRPLSRTERDINSSGILKRIFQGQKYLSLYVTSLYYVGKAIILRLYNCT
jgi:hypothetical protein